MTKLSLLVLVYMKIIGKVSANLSDLFLETDKVSFGYKNI